MQHPSVLTRAHGPESTESRSNPPPPIPAKHHHRSPPPLGQSRSPPPLPQPTRTVPAHLKNQAGPKEAGGRLLATLRAHVAHASAPGGWDWARRACVTTPPPLPLPYKFRLQPSSALSAPTRSTGSRVLCAVPGKAWRRGSTKGSGMAPKGTRGVRGPGVRLRRPGSGSRGPRIAGAGGRTCGSAGPGWRPGGGAGRAAPDSNRFAARSNAHLPLSAAASWRQDGEGRSERVSCGVARGGTVSPALPTELRLWVLPYRVSASAWGTWMGVVVPPPKESSRSVLRPGGGPRKASCPPSPAVAPPVNSASAEPSTPPAADTRESPILDVDPSSNLPVRALSFISRPWRSRAGEEPVPHLQPVPPAGRSPGMQEAQLRAEPAGGGGGGAVGHLR